MSPENRSCDHEGYYSGALKTDPYRRESSVAPRRADLGGAYGLRGSCACRSFACGFVVDVRLGQASKPVPWHALEDVMTKARLRTRLSSAVEADYSTTEPWRCKVGPSFRLPIDRLGTTDYGGSRRSTTQTDAQDWQVGFR